MPPNWFRNAQSAPILDMWEHPDDMEASCFGAYPREIDVYADLLTIEAGADCRVLELGVGFGRVAIPLARRGFHVTGLDRNATMLTNLRRRLGAEQRTMPIIEEDLRDFTVERPFDALLCPFGLLNYVWSERSLRQHLATAARALRPGGIYLAAVVASTRPDRLLPHAASWETEAKGIRTFSDFTLVADPWRGAICEHHLYVDRDGAQKHLFQGGGHRVWTPETASKIGVWAPALRFECWLPIFDSRTRRKTPVDTEPIALAMMRRL